MSYSDSLRQQAKWIREALDPDCDPLTKITLDDIDIDELEAAANEIERLRKVLEIIAGSAADRLQALQARAALDNIGAKVPTDRICAHPHCSCPPDARCPQ